VDPVEPRGAPRVEPEARRPPEDDQSFRTPTKPESLRRSTSHDSIPDAQPDPPAFFFNGGNGGLDYTPTPLSPKPDLEGIASMLTLQCGVRDQEKLKQFLAAVMPSPGASPHAGLNLFAASQDLRPAFVPFPKLPAPPPLPSGLQNQRVAVESQAAGGESQAADGTGTSGAMAGRGMSNDVLGKLHAKGPGEVTDSNAGSRAQLAMAQSEMEMAVKKKKWNYRTMPTAHARMVRQIKSTYRPVDRSCVSRFSDDGGSLFVDWLEAKEEWGVVMLITERRKRLSSSMKKQREGISYDKLLKEWGLEKRSKVDKIVFRCIEKGYYGPNPNLPDDASETLFFLLEESYDEIEERSESTTLRIETPIEKPAARAMLGKGGVFEQGKVPFGPKHIILGGQANTHIAPTMKELINGSRFQDSARGNQQSGGNTPQGHVNAADGKPVVPRKTRSTTVEPTEPIEIARAKAKSTNNKIMKMQGIETTLKSLGVKEVVFAELVATISALQTAHGNLQAVVNQKKKLAEDYTDATKAVDDLEDERLKHIATCQGVINGFQPKAKKPKAKAKASCDRA